MYDNTPSVVVAIIPVGWGSTVLGVKRTDKDKPALPGGWQERPYSVYETAAKEVLEETGIRTDPADYRIFDVQTVPGGSMNLIFVEHIEGIADEMFMEGRPDGVEVSELRIVQDTDELAFPLHTEALRRWTKNL